MSAAAPLAVSGEGPVGAEETGRDPSPAAPAAVDETPGWSCRAAVDPSEGPFVPMTVVTAGAAAPPPTLAALAVAELPVPAPASVTTAAASAAPFGPGAVSVSASETSTECSQLASACSNVVSFSSVARSPDAKQPIAERRLFRIHSFPK